MKLLQTGKPCDSGYFCLTHGLPREKRKRKSNDSSDKPDAQIIGLVHTVVSLLGVFPLDLPECIPSLLSAVVRLSSISSLKSTISRAVQEFKKSHQDRWDEFTGIFTKEQLEDIQGAGAAHYFS